jgi:hypothetical protein
MFASFGEFMGRGLVVIIFLFVTLIMLFKRFAADNPEAAKKVAGAATKAGIAGIKKIIK